MQINQARRGQHAQGRFVCPHARCKVLLSISLSMLLALQSIGPAAAQESAPSTQSRTVQPSSSDKTRASDSSQKEVASVRGTEDLPSAPEPQAPAQAQSSSQEQQSTQDQQQKPASSQQNAPQQPVGTAAAPYEKPTGVPGSRPAGAVIAPAKQKRVRAIVIKVGLLLAGGAAIGTIVGLSKASHSQP